MSNSTTIITDITTVIANGPQGNTSALAIAASGKIMDYKGNCNLILLKAKEMKYLLTMIVADTDSNQDATNLGLLNGILSDLS